MCSIFTVKVSFIEVPNPKQTFFCRNTHQVYLTPDQIFLIRGQVYLKYVDIPNMIPVLYYIITQPISPHKIPECDKITKILLPFLKRWESESKNDKTIFYLGSFAIRIVLLIGQKV